MSARRMLRLFREMLGHTSIKLNLGLIDVSLSTPPPVERGVSELRRLVEAPWPKPGQKSAGS